MARDAVLSLLPDDGGMDVQAYNLELGSISPPPSWLHAPWLYTECYLYRLIHTYFALSTSSFWRKFDAFSTDKRKAFVSSKKGAIELVKHFHHILKSVSSLDEETERAIFEEMIQISLWGNATDLSLLTSGTMEELDSRQGKAARESSKKNVLCDDTGAVFNLLTSLRSGHQKGKTEEIHIVLDNAGFELLTDLIFASYLIESGFTARVVLHGKRMPWFVSDVNQHDLSDLVDGLVEGTLYPPDEISAEDKTELEETGKYWRDSLRSGRLNLRVEPFWTTQHPFGCVCASISPLTLAPSTL